VLAAFGLPGRSRSLTPVAGAWCNRVFRLDTSAGRYAVKELANPFGEPRFEGRLAEAWAFEQSALAAGVAAPEPVAGPGGGCTATVERADGAGTALVRVHRWVAGGPAPAGPVSPAVARWAGATLARLHGLAVRPADRSLFPAPATATADRWPALVAAAPSAGAFGRGSHRPRHGGRTPPGRGAD
jgi:Ser/Thr protein kinase RdoA (MazF antagonist)